MAQAHYHISCQSRATPSLESSNGTDPSSDHNLSALIDYYFCAIQGHAGDRRAHFTHEYSFDAVKASILVTGKPDTTSESSAPTTTSARMRAYFSSPEKGSEISGRHLVPDLWSTTVGGAKQICKELAITAMPGFMLSQLYQEAPDCLMKFFLPN